MKFKNLTEVQIQKITEIYTSKDISWDAKEDLLEEYTGKSSRTARDWASKLGLTKPIDIASPQYEEAKQKKFDKKKKIVLIGWAQNDTPVHEGLLKEMEAYAKYHDAAIHIIAGRYKNPTSVHSPSADTWAKRVKPYLDANRHDIHQYMSIMSDVKIQPTAVHPLTGLQSISKGNSCIFGHPKVHMDSIPVLEGHKSKLMLTTGAVTVPNYTDSKAGKKGEFYHTMGFCIVEIKDKETFFVRQVVAANDGSFNDLYYNVKGGKVSRIKTIDTAVLGDLHYGNHDVQVVDVTFDVLLKKLKPKNLVLHDVFDGESISHHERDDPFKQYAKEMANKNDLAVEIDNMLSFFKRIKKYKFKNTIVARANHDDFIDRWLVTTDWRKAHPKNSLTYSEFTVAKLKGDASEGIIPWLLNRDFPKVMALGRNNSYTSLGWELAQHGDKGTNGSRGSLSQFHKLATKIIVGHYHTPGRKDGALAVGTSTKLRLPYNIGPSSWMHAHVIVHNNGKAQHVFFFETKDGASEYTTFS
jgi:hypothetical protein